MYIVVGKIWNVIIKLLTNHIIAQPANHITTPPANHSNAPPVNHSTPMMRRAASMTAAPFNMVAMRMSWPGQSTNDTWLVSERWERCWSGGSCSRSSSGSDGSCSRSSSGSDGSCSRSSSGRGGSCSRNSSGSGGSINIFSKAIIVVLILLIRLLIKKQ